MTSYNSTILITGATGAIGSALSKAYAMPGNELILQGRNSQLLDNLGKQCKSQGAKVTTAIVDLTNITLLQSWLNALLEQNIPDLVIANAGVNCNNGNQRLGEQWPEIENLIDVNIKSTIALVNTLSPAMRKRGSGQIALISSLAAYYGLPVTPSYCASKAAIKAYGEAMRGFLAPDGVKINIVMPGYIQSTMCDEMPGPKPFLLKPEQAAQIIIRGLRKNKARISFPFPLNWGTWALSVMPPVWSQQILNWLNYNH